MMWKICLWVCLGILLLCCFLPVFIIDIGMGVFGYSLSFFEIAFGTIGDLRAGVFILLPIIMLVLSLIKSNWRICVPLIGCIDLFGIFYLIYYSFNVVAEVGTGLILYFIAMICIMAFVSRIDDQLKKEEVIQIREKNETQANEYSGFTCPNCKNPLRNNVKFCDKCGQAINWQQLLAMKTAVPTQQNTISPDLNMVMGTDYDLNKENSLNSEKESTLFCPNCGNAILGTEKFCQYCGSPIVHPKKCCPNCGLEINENDIFCKECGYKLKQ